MVSDDAPEASLPAPELGDQRDTETPTLATVRADFLDFYLHEHPRVIRHLMVHGASVHDAQDAAQEAFAEAWERLIPSLQWAKITYRRAWIRLVAMRKHYRLAGGRRRLKPTPVSDPPDLPHLDADHAGSTDAWVSLLAAIRKLDKDLREVIALDWDGVPTSEIAAYLGVTSQKVRDLRKKARERLRGALQDADSMEER